MKTKRPPFNSFPILVNDRVILREVLESDCDQLIEISFYDGIQAKDIIDTKNMNERIWNDYLSGNSIHWLITSVISGEILGTCGFYRGFQDKIGEIGYVLKKVHQGKGYMTDALNLIINFGWEKLELLAIKGVTSTYNQASKNVLRKSGFKESETINDEVVFLISSPDKTQNKKSPVD